MAMRILVDSDRCQGHGRCYEVAPDLFDADDEGHAIVRVSQVPDEAADRAVLAVKNCPERAVSIEQ